MSSRKSEIFCDLLKEALEMHGVKSEKEFPILSTMENNDARTLLRADLMLEAINPKVRVIVEYQGGYIHYGANFGPDAKAAVMRNDKRKRDAVLAAGWYFVIIREVEGITRKRALVQKCIPRLLYPKEREQWVRL